MRSVTSSSIVRLTGLLIGLAACQDESASMSPSGPSVGPEMNGSMTPQLVPGQPQAQPTATQPQPGQPMPGQTNPGQPMPGQSSQSGAGSAGHAWCQKMAEKKPSLKSPQDMFVASANDVWYVLNDSSFGSYNTEVDDPDDDVYVVSYYPKIAHWNGSSLCETNLDRLFPKGDPRRLKDLYSIWGSGPDDIWIAGEGGLLLRWDGSNWALQSSPDDSSFVQLLGTRSDNLYGLGNGGMYHWNGQSWRRVSLPGLNGPFQEIWIDAKERIWGRTDTARTTCDLYVVNTDGSVACKMGLADRRRTYRLRRIGGAGLVPWVIIRDGAYNNVVYRLDEAADKWVWTKLATDDVYSVKGFAEDDVWFGGVGVMIHYDGTGFKTHAVPGIGGRSYDWIYDIHGSSSRDMWGIVGGVIGREAGFRGNLDGFTRMN